MSAAVCGPSPAHDARPHLQHPRARSRCEPTSVTDYQIFEEHSFDKTEYCLAQLTQEASAKYQADKHEQLLVDLWSMIYPTDLYERTSSRWSILGFQSDDPARDLRGAGLMSLRHLHQFISAVGTSFLREQASGFSLALASFTCTAMLCRYLGLNKMLIFPGCADHSASAQLQRRFLELHASSGHDVLQRLHVRLLLHMSRQWTAMQTPETTVMDFPIVLKATYTHLHRALTVAPRPWQLGSLLVTLGRESIDSWSVLEACTSSSGTCEPIGLYALFWMLCARLTCRARYEAI